MASPTSDARHFVSEADTPLRIFLSSTSVDLEKDRDAVAHLVKHLGHFAVEMNRFALRPDRDATSISLDELRRCHLYLLLVAWRYGHVPHDATLSVTHQEYRDAWRRGLPCFVFLADPSTDAEDSPTGPYPAAVRDPAHRAQLEALRVELQTTQLVKFFTSREDLLAKVSAALFAYLLERDRRLQAVEQRVPYALPPVVADFVDRDELLMQICGALRDSANGGQCTVIAGMAGAGKSALAFEALRHLAQEDPIPFPAGLTWMRCDEREGPEGLIWVYDQLLAEYSTALTPDELSRASSLPLEDAALLRERALRQRLRLPRQRVARQTEDDAAPTPSTDQPSSSHPASQALVLLDNVEPRFPLAQAASLLATLGVRLLVTTHHVPSVAGLRVWHLDVLPSRPARDLFVARYRERNGAYDDPSDGAAVSRVVETLGRLPLAIELAAARAARKPLGLRQLATDLRKAEHLGNLSDPLDPRSSVRYVFERNLAGLTARQRTRFVALGLLQGPDWPYDLVTTYLDNLPNGRRFTHGASVPRGEDDLEVLVSLSLVNLFSTGRRIKRFPPQSAISVGPYATRDDQSTAPSEDAYPLQLRIRLHPLLHALAAELWRAPEYGGRREGIRALLEAIHGWVRDRATDFEALAHEEVLITEALRAAATAGAELKVLIATVRALRAYLFTAGHWQVGIVLYGLQLAAAQAIGDRESECDSLHGLGTLLGLLGETRAARRRLQQALDLGRQLGDRRRMVATLNNVGRLLDELGEKRQAHRRLLEALSLERQLGDRKGEGATLLNLGLLANSMDRVDEARRHLQQALSIFIEVGDREGEATSLNGLGVVEEDLGRVEDARQHYEQALSIFMEIGDREGEGASLNRLGSLAVDQGRTEDAHDLLEQALSLFTEIGERGGEGSVLCDLGSLATDAARLEDAQRFLQRALSIFVEIGDREGEAISLNRLGVLADEMRKPEDARQFYERAGTTFRQIGAFESARVAETNLQELLASHSTTLEELK